MPTLLPDFTTPPAASRLAPLPHVRLLRLVAAAESSGTATGRKEKGDAVVGEAAVDADAAKADADVDPWTFVFGKPGEFQRDLGLLNTSPERFATAGILAVVIGLAANLWGETELLLTLFAPAGETAVQLKLDQLYAVDGVRAYYGDEYEARFPSGWLLDQRVAMAKFGAGGASPDDYFRSGQKPRSPTAGKLPDAAWGPAGGGDKPLRERENLSVLKQLLAARPGKKAVDITEVLGEPEASLDKLLRETIAPPGGKKTAERIKAKRVSKYWRGTENVYYEYEWRTQFQDKFALRTFSSAAVGPPDERGNRYLYTLTAVVPEEEAVAGSGIVGLMPRLIQGFYVVGSAVP